MSKKITPEEMPVTDGELQMLIKSHKKGTTMILRCAAYYQMAKELQERRKVERDCEPVAYMYRDNLHSVARFCTESKISNWSPEEIIKYEITETLLYRHAQQPVVQPAVIPEWTNEQCLVSDRWIPVSERMPEDGECVVIVDSHHGCFYGGAVALYRAPHFHLMDGLEARNYDGEAVVSIAFETTHWMPLPDAPQEVNHG